MGDGRRRGAGGLLDEGSAGGEVEANSGRERVESWLEREGALLNVREGGENLIGRGGVVGHSLGREVGSVLGEGATG